jgi:PBP1b-binding outer membrane lipoprotein LpoB
MEAPLHYTEEVAMTKIRGIVWIAPLALVLSGCMDVDNSRLPTGEEPQDTSRDTKRGLHAPAGLRVDLA